jgi:hypothetical protein
MPGRRGRRSKLPRVIIALFIAFAAFRAAGVEVWGRHSFLPPKSQVSSLRSQVASPIGTRDLGLGTGDLGLGGQAASRSQAADPVLVARIVANQRAAMKRLEQYCFREQVLDEKLNEDRTIKRGEERDEIVCFYDGVPLYKQLVINGRPTGQKETDPWLSIKRDENWARQVNRFNERRERNDQIMAEIPSAFTFTFVGQETMEGRATGIYQLAPRPGYGSKSRATEMLKHVTARAWIDEEAGCMLRVVATVQTDFDMWGGLLLKVYKGGSYELRQKPFGGVWLPYFAEERWSARIGLFKFLGQHLRTERADFRPNPLPGAVTNQP